MNLEEARRRCLPGLQRELDAHVRMAERQVETWLDKGYLSGEYPIPLWPAEYVADHFRDGGLTVEVTKTGDNAAELHIIWFKPEEVAAYVRGLHASCQPPPDNSAATP